MTFIPPPPPPLFAKPITDDCAKCGRTLNGRHIDTWPTRCWQHPGKWCNACMIAARHAPDFPSCCPGGARIREARERVAPDAANG